MHILYTVTIQDLWFTVCITLSFSGLAFWKAPRRKLYAVTQRDLNMIQDDADDDIDEELAPRAAKRIKNELRDIRDEFRG